MINDEEFEKTLKSNNLGKKFKDEITRVRKDLRKGLKKENKKLEQSYKEEIRRSEYHDQLLSMAIAPFLNSAFQRKTGYKFLRCAPLLEKEVKNLDFLIFKDCEKKPIAIFGEAKSSISNPNQIIDEFIERKKILASHKDYVLKNYLNTNKNILFEYVLVVFSRDISRMKQAIEERKIPIILWSADLAFCDLNLVASDKKEIKPLMLHAESEFCNEIKNLQTYLKIPIHYVQSHVVVRMRSLISVKEYHSAITSTHDQKFTKDELDLYFQKTLHYLHQSLQDTEKKYLLTVASEMKLLKQVEDEYHFTTKSKGMKGQTKEFESTWISMKLTKNREEKLRKKIEEIYDKFRNLDNKQVSLTNYVNEKTNQE